MAVRTMMFGFFALVFGLFWYTALTDKTTIMFGVAMLVFGAETVSLLAQRWIYGTWDS